MGSRRRRQGILRNTLHDYFGLREFASSQTENTKQYFACLFWFEWVRVVVDKEYYNTLHDHFGLRVFASSQTENTKQYFACLFWFEWVRVVVDEEY